MNLYEKLGLGLGTVVATSPVFAAVDTTSVTTGITDALAAIAVAGAGYLSVKIGIKVWPWVASALGR